MPPSREPKGRTLLLVGAACVLATAWTEGTSPGSLAALFWWVGMAVLALTAVAVTAVAVWVILVLAFRRDSDQ
jgi:hypothetical protein